MNTLVCMPVMAGAIWVACFSPVQGQTERPRVGVTFKLEQPTFRSNFSEIANPGNPLSELAQLEEDAARGIASALARQVGFLEIVPGNEAHHISVTLAGDSGTGSLIATSFRLRFESFAPEFGLPELAWQFRTDQEFVREIGPEPADFVKEIVTVFESRLGTRYDELHKGHLTHLSVATEIALIRDDATFYCIFPFSNTEFRATLGCRFRIVTRSGGLINRARSHYIRWTDSRAPENIANLPPAFVGHLVAEESAPPPFDSEHVPLREIEPDMANEARLVEVEGIYLTEYFPIAEVRRVHDPSEL